MSRHRRQAGSLRVEAVVRYWAYGANLSPAVLVRRRLRPLAASPAVLRDHRLLFNHRTGFANVEPANGRSAHGVLYELSDADWLRLIEAEKGYRVRRVHVELYGAADAPSSSGGAGRPAHMSRTIVSNAPCGHLTPEPPDSGGARETSGKFWNTLENLES